MANKSLFLKQKFESDWSNIISKLLIILTIIKHGDILFKVKKKKRKKNAKNVDSKVLKTKNDKTMLSSKCTIRGSRKSRFTKEQKEHDQIKF